MLSSCLYAMIKLAKTSYPQKLFDYDCVTLYNESLKYSFSLKWSFPKRNQKINFLLNKTAFFQMFLILSPNIIFYVHTKKKVNTLSKLRHLQNIIFADKKKYCNNCEWNVSFEIVWAFEWRFIILVACLKLLYKVRKPRMTRLGQDVEVRAH